MYYDIEESGAQIRQLRLKNGLTQEKAANALDIDQSFYGHIESGKKDCSVDLFIRLSSLFGVSLDYLILGRYTSDLPQKAYKTQLKTDIATLINSLKKIHSSL